MIITLIFLRIHNKLTWYPFWHIPVWYREAIWSWPACWYTCHVKQTHSLHKSAPRKTGPWRERINRKLSNYVMAKFFHSLCQLEEYCFVKLDSLTPNACICIATSLTTAEQNVGGTMWNTAPYSLRWLPWIPEVVSGRTGAPGPANTITSSAFTNVCRHNIINLVKMHDIKMTLKKWRKWDKLFT